MGNWRNHTVLSRNKGLEVIHKHQSEFRIVAIQKLRYVAEWNLFHSKDNIVDSLY